MRHDTRDHGVNDAAVKTISDLLEEYVVVDRGMLDPSVVSWWPEALPFGVSDPDHGIVALFVDESAALGHRLALINQRLT